MLNAQRHPFSFLSGAAVMLDAAPAAASLRSGLPLEVGDGDGDAKLVSALPRPRRRLIGRGPVEVVAAEMLAEDLAASEVHESAVLDDEYSVPGKTRPAVDGARGDSGAEGGANGDGPLQEKKNILVLGALRLDMSALECVLRVRAGCYLLPQAGARALAIVLEIPPKRPTMSDGTDEPYVFVDHRDDEGEDLAHPVLETFESCLKENASLINIAALGEEGGAENGTSLRECDRDQLVLFANGVFADCDELLTNVSSKQGSVGTAVASTIRFTGNALCRALITSSVAAGVTIKALGKGMQTFISPSEEKAEVSHDVLHKIEQAEWVGEKAVGASNFVVSSASKALKYTGKVVGDQILRSDVNKYLDGGGGANGGKAGAGAAHAVGTVLEAMFASAVDLQLSLKKSTWNVFRDLTDTAVDVIDHTYGADAADASKRSLSAAINVGSATTGVSSIARNATSIAREVAKESGDQIISMQGWMDGAMQMHGTFECREARGWGLVWGLLRPQALAIYTQSDLVQERPQWVVAVMDISLIESQGLGRGRGPQEANGHPAGGENGHGGVRNGRSWKIRLGTRSNASWDLSYESQELASRWYEALVRCVRSNARCKLLGCTVDGIEC